MSLLTTLTASGTDTLLVVIFDGLCKKIDRLILQIFLLQEVLWLVINF